MKFYVYEWYVIETGEIFYVGKGCRNRYKAKNKRRGRVFNAYVSNLKCESRIIRWFDDEDSAYEYETMRIAELKKVGMANANNNKGGSGSYQTHVTEEMRRDKSEQNPMKSLIQRQRMKLYNPMKNKDIAAKVAKQTKRPVIINGVRYDGVLEAKRITKRSNSSIIKWCKRGYDDCGNPCRYENEPQKEVPPIKKLHPKAATTKIVVIDGIEYETVLDGAKAIGGNSSNLIKAIKAHRKYRGHIVGYGNQNPSQTKPGK